MTYIASKTRTWNQSTPADGDLFEAEFNRIYENTDYNKEEVEKRVQIANIVDTFDSVATDQPLSANAGNLLLTRGFTRGRLHVYQSSPGTVRVPKWNLYEVSDKLIRVASELTLDFAALTNIYRNDGTTPIAASSEIQNKHLYLFISDAGALSAMIVPDAEMDTGDHTYLANPELVKDSYTSKSIYDASKNAYYKNSKRIIATLRCNASNQIEFWYELGFGNRFMDVQDLPVGGLFTEFRWSREHPGCFVGDNSTITDMATDFPVLYQVLGSNVLPDMVDRVGRNIAVGGSRAVRDTQEDAFQGFAVGVMVPCSSSGSKLSLPNNLTSNSNCSLYSTGVTSIETHPNYGVPRVTNETRMKNYAQVTQIVKG